MPQDLAIETQGSFLTDHETQFVAVGMEGKWTYEWVFTNVQDEDAGGTVAYQADDGKSIVYRFANAGIHKVVVTAKSRTGEVREEIVIAVQEKPLTRHDTLPVRIVGDVISGPITVDLQRAPIADTPDLPLWSVIRASTNKLSFNNYQTWMDRLFCGSPHELRKLFGHYVRNTLPFPDIISYKALKFATEAFLLANCGVAVARGDLSEFDELDAPVVRSLDRERFENLSEEERDDRLGLDKGDTASRLWRQYLVPLELEGDRDGDRDRDDYEVRAETLPYLALIRRNLPEWRIDLRADAEEEIELCDTIMGRKFTSPCFIELLWSYWHEEGMLVHTMHAITRRFQNRSSGPRDPLAGMALDPLRPLNNLLWGYIQDEQHRLTRTRRVFEYDHEYGLTLFGRSAPRLRSADSRSRFLEAFHTLLHRASIFYKEDDDTTMVADPFPVLNALRDVHLLLAEGSDNAYGGLRWTARHEMLMQQWLLARPELREFLPTRTMIAYPEEWMHRVDAMKRLQGWTETSVRYFRDLAVFGEQIVLSIRYGNWSNTFDREQAGNWARYWREEIKWYTNAYECVTGVDISADTQDVRHGQRMADRFTQPSFLIRDRLMEQRRHLPRYAMRRGRHGHHHAGLPPGSGVGHELEAEEPMR